MQVLPLLALPTEPNVATCTQSINLSQNNIYCPFGAHSPAGCRDLISKEEKSEQKKLDKKTPRA